MGNPFYVFAPAALAAIALTTASCGSKTGDSATLPIDNFEINETFKTASATYSIAPANGGDEYTADYTQTAVSIQWPVKYGENDITSLQDSLIANVFGLEGVTIDQAITSFLEMPLGYGDYDLTLVDEPRPGGDVWLTSVSAHTVGFCERYIVYRITEFEDNGGAHPSYASKFLNYDIRRNAVLDFNDIFSPGNDEALLDAVVAGLLDLYFAYSPEELEEKSGIITESIYLTHNIYITGSDIVFHYNPYEIAPGSVGPIEVQLHEYDLEEFLTPEALALFWWNDGQFDEK